MAITRLGTSGVARSLHGSFSGKGIAPVVVATVQFGKKFYTGESKFKSIKDAEMKREAFELMTIIKIIGNYLL